MKSERALKVVIRHLHSSTTTEEIKEALEELGFACRNVVNIRHWQTKSPLPLFFVDIEPDEHANEIYKVSTLLQSRIKIESPRPKRTIAQCHRCQQLGHTKTYCTLPPVCVKCGEEHTWNSCPKPSDAKPTCGLCQGDHQANYRGCPSHKPQNPTSTTRRNSPIQQGRWEATERKSHQANRKRTRKLQIPSPPPQRRSKSESKV